MQGVYDTCNASAFVTPHYPHIIRYLCSYLVIGSARCCRFCRILALINIMRADCQLYNVSFTLDRGLPKLDERTPISCPAHLICTRTLMKSFDS